MKVLYLFTRTSNRPIFFEKLVSNISSQLDKAHDNVLVHHVIHYDDDETFTYVNNIVNKYYKDRKILCTVETTSNIIKEGFFYNLYINTMYEHIINLSQKSLIKREGYIMVVDDDCRLYSTFIRTTTTEINKAINKKLLLFSTHHYCLVQKKQQVLPPLMMRQLLHMGEKMKTNFRNFLLRKLIGKVDSLNICVNLDYFERWEPYKNGDYNSLKRILGKIDNFRRDVTTISNVTIGYVNPEGEGLGTQCDSKKNVLKTG
jgi:hypothetical protein